MPRSGIVHPRLESDSPQKDPASGYNGLGFADYRDTGAICGLGMLAGKTSIIAMGPVNNDELPHFQI
jgi:hypothetical protein